MDSSTQNEFPSKKDEAHLASKGEDNIDDTLQRLDSEIEKNPNDIGLYRIKVALLTDAGRFEESIQFLDKIIEHDPEDKKVWYEKGEVLLILERFREAIECYDRIVQMDHNYVKAWLERGNALRKLRTHELEDDLEILDKERRVELEDALDSLTVVTDRIPNSVEAWCGRGDVLYTLHRYEEATQCYNRCIEIDPNFIRAWHGIGKTFQKLDMTEESKQSFKVVIGLRSNDVHLKVTEDWCAMAYSFYELGFYTEAFECIDKFIERYPDNYLALACKGVLLEKTGREEEAALIYQNALELNSSRAYVWYRLGNVMRDAGDFDKAVLCYNEAVQITSGFEEAWFRIGELLKIRNNTEKAKECFSWVLEINPDNKKAKKALLTFVGDKLFFEGEARKSKLRKVRKKRKKRRKKMVESEYSYDEYVEDTEPQEESFAVESFMDSYDHHSLEIAEEEETISDSKEDIDAGLNELQELIDQETELVSVENPEIFQTDDIPLDGQDLELELPSEDTTESYKDFETNLDEFEKMLIQDVEGKEESTDDESDILGSEGTSEDEETPDSYDGLYEDLDELQELLVEKTAHLDGQNIHGKPSAEVHLDGHPISKKNPDEVHLDAHKEGYNLPNKNQAVLETLVIEGREHMAKGELQKAMYCFDRALELDPNCVDAWGAKGDLLLHMDEDQDE
ncbi:MAG: tetratricopeptide repeat protein [Methanomassiliicoccales archaeon]|nr:MAG: tetratricopeptide repeat protein [Methanomassiliicoccales archaeon]